MFKRIKPVYEHCSFVKHPEAQNVTTTVSEYLRKFGQGKIDNVPQDPRSEVKDDRSEDQMLSDDARTDHMAFDELDAIAEFERKREDFEKAYKDIEMSQKQRQDAEHAIKILDDPNSSEDARREAYALIDELLSSGKAKRTRARN